MNNSCQLRIHRTTFLVCEKKLLINIKNLKKFCEISFDFRFFHILDHKKLKFQNFISQYQLNVLSEYDLERYAFPPELPTSEEEVMNQVDDGEDTILYRISSGPKSPKMPGKKPVFIENAILCDRDPCEVNKPKIAVGEYEKQ